MSWWKTALGLGLAPITGGMSLWPTIIGAGIGAGAQYGLSKLGGGGKKKDDGVSPDDPSNMLRSYAGEKMDTGRDLIGSGDEALSRVLSHYKDLTGNDPSALLAATAPQRGRVMDQYDTARKTISQFGPRGGGSAGAFADATFREATDLSEITSMARENAFNQSAQLGTQLTGLGLSAEQLASADLDTVLRAILTREGHDIDKRGQNMEMWGGLGEASGNILASILLGRGST